MLDFRPHCSCEEDELLAAIRAIEKRRDEYIKGIATGERPIVAGLARRYQDDVTSLVDMIPLAWDSRMRREAVVFRQVREAAVAAASGVSLTPEAAAARAQ